ncbi:unnamed protein product [Acanthoscelides obtectus]|uniref:Heparanase n=1 Tax=Acanthoscelides obtectus TaxID=200917 RepID=A0A9P0KEY6_ACAOB|nr:unnamed protein product [Acanthoscelides obtectus]CAK1632478.1 Heparanase [Acanthoscelides obtectus]
MYIRMKAVENSGLHYLVKLCRDLCVWVIAVTIVLLFLLLLVTESFPGTYRYVQIVHIHNEEPPAYITDEKFLSIGLDCFVIATGFKGFNTSSPKLVKMMRHLSPSYLRIGGNLADRLIFDPESDEPYKYAENLYNQIGDEDDINYQLAPNYSMTGRQWIDLVKLTEKANLDAIFDLNSLLRQSDGEWDYHNAETLIEFSQNNSLKLNWELGNEPNSYHHKFNTSVSPEQLAKDFQTLKSLLEEYPLYSNAMLVGPDVDRLVTKNGQNEEYLRVFLSHIGRLIDAITWHQYYVNGRTATAQDFLNPVIFDTLKTQIKTMKSILNGTHLSNKPFWLGETASAYGGGAPNLSDTFIGVFLWVDKLGLCAKLGVNVVIRQSIFKEYYALLDKNYDPNPDYWVSILYKRLVGHKVLNYFTVTMPTVRLYAHCSSKNIPTNSVVIFGSNLGNTEANIKLEPSDSNSLIVVAYELTSDSLLSKNIRLNGRLLKLRRNYELPTFVPKFTNTEPYVKMPPYSIVFWVVKGLNVKTCSN